MCLLQATFQISCAIYIIISLVAFVGLLTTVARKPAVIRVSPPVQGTMDKGKKCEVRNKFCGGVGEIGWTIVVREERLGTMR